VQELTAIRMQLQSDRDSMDAELQDSRESIRDLQSRLDSANSVMNQLKVDLDTRCLHSIHSQSIVYYAKRSLNTHTEIQYRKCWKLMSAANEFQIEIYIF